MGRDSVRSLGVIEGEMVPEPHGISEGEMVPEPHGRKEIVPWIHIARGGHVVCRIARRAREGGSCPRPAPPMALPRPAAAPPRL